MKDNMVSLDTAVLARWEYGGKRYEILVDPDLVESFRQDPSSVNIDDFLATDEVWHDAKGGDRPTEEAIESTFGTQEIDQIAAIILEKGSIQLTTNQRKEMVEQKRQLIIQEIHSTAIDPKSKSPHPKTRIELALEECRFSANHPPHIEMYSKKTGKLFEFSFAAPFIIKGEANNRIKFSKSYGALFGTIFQIMDDLFDEVNSFKEIGKTPGKDKKQGKSTAK